MIARAPRLWPALFALALLGVAPDALSTRAPSMETRCPKAAADVRAFNETIQRGEALADDVIRLAERVAERYDACAGEMSSAKDFEGVGYAWLHAAQFRLKAGQIQRLVERYELAKESLLASIDDARRVFGTWQTTTRIVTSSGTSGGGSGHGPFVPSGRSAVEDQEVARSPYRDAALDVCAHAEAELKLIPRYAPPSPKPGNVTTCAIPPHAAR